MELARKFIQVFPQGVMKTKRTFWPIKQVKKPNHIYFILLLPVLYFLINKQHGVKQHECSMMLESKIPSYESQLSLVEGSEQVT